MYWLQFFCRLLTEYFAYVSPSAWMLVSLSIERPMPPLSDFRSIWYSSWIRSGIFCGKPKNGEQYIDKIENCKINWATTTRCIMNENQIDVIPFRRMVVYLGDPDSYEFFETSTKVSGVLLYNKSPVSIYCRRIALQLLWYTSYNSTATMGLPLHKSTRWWWSKSPKPMLLLHAAILNCG